MSNGSRPIPLLLNHDHSRVIGRFEYDRGGCLVATFDREQALTCSQLFDALGHCGMRIDELEQRDGESEPRIIKATILEWSFCPAPAKPAVTGS